MRRDGPLTSQLKTMLAGALGVATMPKKSQKVTVSEEIAPDQAKALAVLLRGETQSAAAAEAGVTRETVSRWLNHDPRFMAVYQNSRAELVGCTRRELATLGQDAVKALRESLAQNAPAALRLRAALAVLSMLGADHPEEIKCTTADELETEMKIEASNANLRKVIASIGE